MQPRTNESTKLSTPHHAILAKEVKRGVTGSSVDGLSAVAVHFLGFISHFIKWYVLS